MLPLGTAPYMVHSHLSVHGQHQPSAWPTAAAQTATNCHQGCMQCLLWWVLPEWWQWVSRLIIACLCEPLTASRLSDPSIVGLWILHSLADELHWWWAIKWKGYKRIIRAALGVWLQPGIGAFPGGLWICTLHIRHWELQCLTRYGQY